MKNRGLLLSDLITETSKEPCEAERNPWDWSKQTEFRGSLGSTRGVENFPCGGMERFQQSVSFMLKPQGGNTTEGEMASDDRQRDARMDDLPSNPSAPAALEGFDVDSWSREEADRKLCSPKKALSNSDGEYS